ncbi:MAG: SDR family oxidoreductase [Gammaproteobacteria bacterium]
MKQTRSNAPYPMFDRAQRAFLHSWGQSISSTMDAYTGICEKTGAVLDHAYHCQFRGVRTCLRSNSRQMETAWDFFNHLLLKRPEELRRVALVTGGTGSIATEICKHLSTTGRRVIAGYPHGEEKLARQWQNQRRYEGHSFEIIQCQISDFDCCVRMVSQVQSQWGPIDILVNCPMSDNKLGSQGRTDSEAVLDADLDHVFNVTKNVVEGMVQRGFGRIVNLSSLRAAKGEFGQLATRAAMIGFTRSLARELADHGITVNTVSPGYIVSNEPVPEDTRQAILSKIPARRLGEPEEIAHAVAFLTAEESGYITGTDIAVNGGLAVS